MPYSASTMPGSSYHFETYSDNLPTMDMDSVSRNRM